MIRGTWFDWLVILLGIILLVPRLIAYALNTSLISYLQRYAAGFGLTFECQLGSISFRAIKDIRIRMGRWRLPQHPNLYGEVEITIDCICIQLCQKKPFTLGIKGARVRAILSEETAAEKQEREREEAEEKEQKKLQDTTLNLPPAAAASAASPTNHRSTPTPFLRAEISTRSLVDAASRLESSVVQVTAAAASSHSTPLPFLSGFTHRCVLKLTEWVSINIARTEFAVQRGDVQLTVCDVGLNVWIGDGSTHTSKQIHVDFHGLAVRLERVSTHATYRMRVQASEEVIDERMRMPPLLQLLPTEIAVEMELSRCIPIGVESVDVQSGGLEVTLDPSMQLEAIQQGALEFIEQIKELNFHLPQKSPTSPATASSSSSTGSIKTIPSAVPSSSSSSSTDSCSSLPPPSTNSRTRTFCAERRQFALRFIPKHTKLHFEHLKVEMLQRDESGVVEEQTKATPTPVSTCSLTGLRHRTWSLTAIAAECSSKSSPTQSDLESPALRVYTPYPIMNRLLLRFNKAAILSSVKTAYPVCDGSGAACVPPEENSISSIDWSVNMAGPSIWMSQQGMVHPRLDVEYCKFSGHSSANFAASGASPHGVQNMTIKTTFPIAAPLHASAGAGAGMFYQSQFGESASTSKRRKHGSGSVNLHLVDSLFHPTNAYRPQTVHAISFVCVSLRTHTFPSSAEWSRYVVGLIWKVEEFIEGLPLKQQPDPQATASSSTSSSSSTTNATPLSSTATATPSTTMTASEQTIAMRKFSSITSPESYLRQINLQQSTTSASGSTSPMPPFGTVFPSFPFTDAQGVPPAGSPNPPSASPAPTQPPLSAADLQALDPYRVQSAVTINVKVVDFHLAVYPKKTDTLPLLHISMGEVSLRYDIKPPTSTFAIPVVSAELRNRFDPANASLPATSRIAVRGSERIEVVVSGLVGSMPQEIHNPYALAPHTSETLRAPGRFFQLHAATLIVDKHQRDIMFSADGLALRWSGSVLMMGPALVGLGIEHMATRPVNPNAQPSSSTASVSSSSSSSSTAPPLSPPSPPPSNFDPPIRQVHGTVTNVIVDFPYVLEFKSDHATKRRKSKVALIDMISPMTTGRSIMTPNKNQQQNNTVSVLSPPASAKHFVMMSDLTTSMHTDATSASGASRPPQNSSSSSSSSSSPPSSSPFAADSPSGGLGSAQQRPTSLFTYQSSIINLDVNILENAWSLLLYQSNCLSEGESFLTLLNASISGTERSLSHPKGMNVTGDQIIGSWRPALQLGLFKVVKDCVSTAINFKYALCQVIPSWKEYYEKKTYTSKNEGKDQTEAEFQAEMDAALEADASYTNSAENPSYTGIDYSSDPMAQLLDLKSHFIRTFRRWYHHLRARYLPEPFMYVTLSTTNLLFDAALNRQETLGCVIRVQTFSSNFVPHQYSFTGVSVDFMKKPIIFVSEVHLNRVGLPNVEAAFAAAVGAGARQQQMPKDKSSTSTDDSTDPTSTPPHPLMFWTEEHNLLSDYLDLSLELKDVRIEIAPALDIGGVIDLIFLKVQALVAGILDLPKLDTLSRRTGGPGYVGPPDKAPPGLLLSLTSCQFEVVDEPFESWLQHLHLLWLDERAEQERRRALLRLKIETMTKEGQFEPHSTTNASTIRSGHSSTTSHPSSSTSKESVESLMYAQLSEWNSRSYYTRVEKLKKSFRGSDSLKKAPLLNLTIASMLMAMGFDGQHGNFYEEDNVLRVIRTCKQEEEEGWQELAKRRHRHETEEANQAQMQRQNTMSPPADIRGLGDQAGVRHDIDSPELSHSLDRMHSNEDDAATGAIFSNHSPPVSAAMPSDIPDEVLIGGSSLAAVGIEFLSARYFKVSLTQIEVKLRNFPLPLFSCVEASLNGHAALVQMKHRDMIQQTHGHSNSETCGSTCAHPAGSPSNTNATPLSPHLLSIPLGNASHSRTTSEPLPSSIPPVSERAAVSIGGVHTVAVEKKYRPPQMFYDISGLVSQASVAFSPCFLYTLRDVYDAMDRVVPPLPELHPIQPIPGEIGLGSLGLATARKGTKGPTAASSAAASSSSSSPSNEPRVVGGSHCSIAHLPTTQSEAEIDPVNYIHLFRGIAHGRFTLAVKDTEVKLLASNDPYEASKYLQLGAGLCQVSFEKSIFKVQVHQITAMQIPSRPKQPFLMELPQLELHTTVLWVCTEVAMNGGDRQHAHTPSSNYATLNSSTASTIGSPSSSSSKGKASSSPSRSSQQTNGHAHVTFSPRSLGIPGNSASSSSQSQPVTPTDGVVSHEPTQHVCNMHLSLSVYFSSHSPYPGPLSVTLHSGSLASLVQFSQVYARIPPLPFPRSTPLTKIDADTMLMVRPLSEVRKERELAEQGGVPSKLAINTPVNSPITATLLADYDEMSASPEALSSSAPPTNLSVSPDASPTIGVSIFSPTGELISSSKSSAASVATPLIPNRSVTGEKLTAQPPPFVPNVPISHLPQIGEAKTEGKRQHKLLRRRSSSADDLTLEKSSNSQATPQRLRPHVLLSAAASTAALTPGYALPLPVIAPGPSGSPVVVVAASPWRPKSLRVELHGLYIERILLEKIHLTIWEGADLGPARGLRLAMEHVYLAAELQEEIGRTEWETERNLKSNKLIFPFAKMKVNLHQQRETMQLSNDGYSTETTHTPYAPMSTSSSVTGGLNTLNPNSASPPPQQQMIFWSLSNTICGISKLSGLLVYNERWRELADQEQDSAHAKMDSIFGGSRVVIYTYENQRYTLGLGWSAKNLLPTDRSPWTNENGSQKLLREDVKLPSDDWVWENDWHLDFQLRRSGEVDEEGWEYAHDFPRKYSRVRTWYCNVRRRRWIRVRKLKASLTSHSSMSQSVSSTSRSTTFSPATSPGSSNPEGKRSRRGLKSENAENFVLSLARITVQQKQDQHSPEIAMLVLDRERALFRLITAPIFSRYIPPKVVKRASQFMTDLSKGMSGASVIRNDAVREMAVCNAFIASPFTSPEPDGRLHTPLRPPIGTTPNATSPLPPTPADATAARPSTNRSMSSQDRSGGTSQSLLNFFHIPHSAPTLLRAASMQGGSNGATSPAEDALGKNTQGVHNVHRLDEVEFMEATIAAEELKRLHATTSSIVTVGSGLGMNHSLNDGSHATSTSGEVEHFTSDNWFDDDQGRARSSTRGVRFNEECVLDQVRAERRRKSINMQDQMSGIGSALSSSLCRPDLAAVHSVRLYDFKILLTIEIRSTLTTLIDQYVATIMELVRKQSERVNQAKYNRRGGRTLSFGDEQEGGIGSGGNPGSTVTSMTQYLENEFSSSIGGGTQEKDDVLASGPPSQSPSPSLTSPPSLLEMGIGENTSAEITVGPAMNASQQPRLGIGGDTSLVTMEDLLRETQDDDDDDDETSVLSRRTVTANSEFSSLPPRGSPTSQLDNNARRGRTMSTVSDTSQSSPITTNNDEVHELFLLEIINPQINVHSEQTRGRILFMTQKLAVIGRVHFKTNGQSEFTTTTVVMSSPPMNAVSSSPAGSPTMPRSRANSDANRSPGGFGGGVNIVAPTPRHRRPSGSSFVPSSASPPPSKLDRLHVTVMVDQLQAFVAPTDVDVDAGVIWLSSSTAGIFKSIMHPSSFVCTLSLKPGLPAFSKIPDGEDKSGVSGVGSGSGNSMNEKSKAENTNTSSQQPALSKATQHMSHHHLFTHTKPLIKSTNGGVGELHSLDLNLPELVLCMDSYQFALFLDVMKTVSSPLPIQAIDRSLDVDEDSPTAADEINTASCGEDCDEDNLQLKADVTKAHLTILEWEMRHVEWILSGLTANASSVTAPKSTTNAAAAAAAIAAAAPPTSTATVSSSPTVQDSPTEPPASSSSASSLTFSSWLSSTVSKYKRHSLNDRDDLNSGSADILSKFHDLLREHSKFSTIYLKLMLGIRIRDLERQPQAAPQNIAVSVFLSKICFNLKKQEKNLLSIYVEGIQGAAHLYDDASADVSLEISSFGARNTMAAYQNPASKEYAWAEIIMPLHTQSSTGTSQITTIQESRSGSSSNLHHLSGTERHGGLGGGAHDLETHPHDVSSSNLSLTSLSSRNLTAAVAAAAKDTNPNNLHTIENQHQTDQMISLHGVKREEYNSITKISTIIIQHLELNIYPLQIRCTYDTLSALTGFFVDDQEAFNFSKAAYSNITIDGDPSSAGNGEDSKENAAALKNKKQYVKYKSKFLPTGSHILDQEQALMNNANLNASVNASSSATSNATSGATSSNASGGNGGHSKNSSLSLTPSNGGSGKSKGFLDSLKHSRVVSVAKEFYHTHTGTNNSASPSAAANLPHGNSDLYDQEPNSGSLTHPQAGIVPPSPASRAGVNTIAAPFSTRHKRSNSSEEVSLLESPGAPCSTLKKDRKSSVATNTRGSMSTGSTGSNSSSSSSSALQPRARVYQFMYIRFGSTIVNVSYWGNKQNSTNAIEDFQGLRIRFKQILFQKKLWTMDKFLEHCKKELIRNILGQVSNALGSFISYKLGFRNDSISTNGKEKGKESSSSSLLTEAKNKLLNGGSSTKPAAQQQQVDDDSDDDEVGNAFAFSASPDSSALLAHFDHELASSGVSQATTEEDSNAVRTLLFGSKKSSGQKMIASIAALLPSGKDKSKHGLANNATHSFAQLRSSSSAVGADPVSQSSRSNSRRPSLSGTGGGAAAAESSPLKPPPTPTSSLGSSPAPPRPPRPSFSVTRVTKQ